MVNPTVTTKRADELDPRALASAPPVIRALAVLVAEAERKERDDG